MKSWMFIFKEKGGWKLIKQYLMSGALFTAVAEFILLGRSQTALAILRLSAQLKTKQKLERQYRDKLEKFDACYDLSLPHVSSSKVWVCWFQGMENAPEIVQRCYQSLQDNLKSCEIILITAKNIGDYVTFPDFILDKWESGQISNTHMSDLLRLELLIQYGGMWLDATVFCTTTEIPDYYFASDLFFYQFIKPQRSGRSHMGSSWLISAKSNNKVLMAVRYLCYEYWKTHKELIDYFLLHDFMAIALEYYREEWKKVIPRDNTTSHILLLRLFDQYDKEMWEAIKEQTPFHKLSYKFNEEDTMRKNTYYQKIIHGI